MALQTLPIARFSLTRLAIPRGGYPLWRGRGPIIVERAQP